MRPQTLDRKTVCSAGLLAVAFIALAASRFAFAGSPDGRLDVELAKRFGVLVPPKSPPAPDFQLQDLRGRTKSLKQLGGELVLLVFATSW